MWLKSFGLVQNSIAYPSEVFPKPLSAFRTLVAGVRTMGPPLGIKNNLPKSSYVHMLLVHNQIISTKNQVRCDTNKITSRGYSSVFFNCYTCD